MQILILIIIRFLYSFAQTLFTSETCVQIEISKKNIWFGVTEKKSDVTETTFNQSTYLSSLLKYTEVHHLGILSVVSL